MASDSTAVRKNGHDAAGQFFEFSLLGLLTSGYLALAGSGYLDLVTNLATGLAILTRAVLVASGRRFPLDGTWITVLTIAYMAFYPLDIFFISSEFLSATVHLVLFLAVVKILTARSGRDHLFVCVIAFLEILAASILSASSNYFLFLALFLLFAVSTLASWEIRRSAGGGRAVIARNARLPWRLSFLATATTVGVLLITVGLFFILPRTARAAFARFAPERFHITAFSDEVTLGEIGEVKQQATVLMHVRIPSANGLVHLKWRGNALESFDGKRWFSPPGGEEPLRVQQDLLRIAGDEQRRRSGRRLNYEVQLKSFASDVIFIAGRPEFIRIEEPFLIRTPADSYRVSYRKSGVLRYGVYSLLDDPVQTEPSLVDELPADVRRRNLELPIIDPRINGFTRGITAGATGAEGRARAIERYLRTAYRYSLRLPEKEQDEPIAHFLFDRREGHCEYFASAMAVMLRTIGIPARVATGFQSGIYNPLSGWHVIRASDAHSWVEAYLPGRGWVTFDPTPPDPSAGQPGLFTRLTLLLDAADTFWQEWVLDYDLNRQLVLASRMERSSRRFSLDSLRSLPERWQDLTASVSKGARENGPAVGISLLALAAFAIAALPLRRWWAGRERVIRAERGDARADDATLLYLRALAMLERSGISKPPWVTPGEFANQIPAPATAALVADLTTAYNELRFGDRAAAAGRILELLGELETRLKAHPRMGTIHIAS